MSFIRTEPVTLCFLYSAGMKLDSETKSRDDKYAELDAKFGRLQKRAKQRIQEVQKVRILPA